MEPGFEKADTGNLPVVNWLMIPEYYRCNPDFTSAEMRNVKSQRAGREKYGDDAIGYVQINREGICIVKAKNTPEHRVREKPYDVTVQIDENNSKIIIFQCYGCTASLGGCKHSIATIFWLYRRSMEPSVTSDECYWRSSKLSKVGRTMKSMTIKDIFSGPDIPKLDELFSNKVKETGVNAGSKGIFVRHYSKENIEERVSLHNLSLRYREAIEERKAEPDAEEFINYLKDIISKNDVTQIKHITADQAKNSVWYEVRYCRITASRLYETVKCKTSDGSLVEKYFGANKIIQTQEMIRGINLEDQVIAEVRKKYNIKTSKVGLVICEEHPIFGASPDAVSDEYCIEVKCPAKEKTKKKLCIR